VIGIVFADRKYVILFVSISVLGILLSYGDNLAWFNYAMFDYFPGYNKFRSVTFAIILPIFAIPMLGMLGLEKLMKKPVNSSNRKKLWIALGVPAGICLLTLLFAGTGDFMKAGEEQLPQWFLNALREDRIGLLRADALRSLVFISIAGILVYLGWIGKVRDSLWVAGLVLLIAIDVWTVDIRYFGEENYRRISDRSFFTATDADKAIMQDNSPGYRVLNLQNPFAEARTSYFHQSIGGYHGAKIRRYQDLIDYCIQPEIQSLIQGFQSGNPNLSQAGVLNMLNAKYLVYGPETNNIILNDQVNGPSWFVEEVIPVDSPDEEIQRTCAIDTRRQAVIDASKFDWAQSSLSVGQITVQSYAPNAITYTTSNRGTGLAVFSEIYYPEGWKVAIDGVETDMLRVNYVLRALEVPAGEHTITFSFEPSIYATGNTIMLISSVMLILFFLAAVIISFRSWRQEETA
jgi:predicted small integral membrane protein